MVNFRKTSLDIIDLGKMIIVAVLMVVVVYTVISNLLSQVVGQFPGQIAGGIISLGSLYYYAVKTKIKQEIDDWLKKQ